MGWRKHPPRAQAAGTHPIPPLLHCHQPTGTHRFGSAHGWFSLQHGQGSAGHVSGRLLGSGSQQSVPQQFIQCCFGSNDGS